jgi:hypothetical protein
MGHGNPVPYELLTGFWASRLEMTNAAVSLFEKILIIKNLFFVQAQPHKRTLAWYALQPYEYILWIPSPAT